MDSPQLLTLIEAAKYLHLNQNVFRTRVVNNGLISYVRLSPSPRGKRMFLKESLDKYIQDNTYTVKPDKAN
jgi:hypothetical protein